MRHFGAVICAVTSTDTHIDGGTPIVIPLPLLTIEGGLSEDSINHLRVIPGTKSYQGAKGGIGFGVRAVVGDVPLLKELAEFISVLLFAQITDEVKGNLVSITALAELLLFGSAHIFIESCKHGVGAFLERLFPHHIPGEYGKAVREVTYVKLKAIAGIFYIECAIKLRLSVFVGNKGELSNIALAVDMNPTTADRTFGI